VYLGSFLLKATFFLFYINKVPALIEVVSALGERLLKELIERIGKEGMNLRMIVIGILISK
jgi:hypothetical protein